MKKLTLLATFFLLALISCNLKNESLKLYELRTEYSNNPLGIDVLNPRFSWILADTVRNVVQESYEILVATKPDLLKPGKADMWESGIKNTSQSIFIEYGGKELESSTRYFWKVIVSDNHGRRIESSNKESFETGKLHNSDWKADWIGFWPEKAAPNLVPENQERPRSIILRKEFIIPSKIKNARVYITGLGNYVLYINGHKIGNDLLTPGWTDYRKRIQYQVYDITDQLKKGDNAAGILLGNMWWTGGLGWMGGQVYSEGPLRAFAQIEIEYQNGKKETIVTNSSWKANLSPITENSIYHGETWDARLEIPLWSEPGLNDSGWFRTEAIPMENITLSAQKAPPVRVVDTIVPVTVKEVKPGVVVYDMGLNMVGFVKLKVSGKNGDTIQLRFAELLYEDGTVAQENLRSARATDSYILRGTGEETWQPSFTYHGFRYVQMEGYAGTASIENITGLRFYSSAPETGHFSSSNELLNSIWGNVMNGQKGNMHSVPTDCPQRDERLGWMGDVQIFAPTSAYNMDMAQFYAKWLQDITDSQHESGYVFDVNPAIVVDGPSKAGWGDAITVVPMVVYRFFGDKSILKDSYNGMKAWVEYMRRKSEGHIYRWSEKKGDWEGYGDWISVVKSPVEPISAAYYFYSIYLLSETAKILDYNEDAAHYTLLADSIREAFHAAFFDETIINYPEKTQTANLLPLFFGLTPDNYKEKIAENVINDVIERGFHPSTGFLGTAHLLPVLSEYNAHNVAYKTAKNEQYPSWGYMVRNGATSMWELWNSDTEPPEGMNSRNHFALGSVVEWYYSYLAGIRPLKPGFKEILIQPMPAEGLDWVTSSLQTPYGLLKASWSMDGDRFHQDITIPANTKAFITVPVKNNTYKSLTESGNVILKNGDIAENDNIKVLEADDKKIRLEVNSGNYAFTLVY